MSRHVFACPRLSVPVACALAVAALAAALTGCHRKEAIATAASGPASKPKEAPTISEIDLKSYHPNEAGAIMVIMYHRFESTFPSSDKKYNRTPDDFRKDLDNLYKRNYRPVMLSEYVDDKMDVPAGKTPVVLTFDDSWDTQFKIITGKDGQAHIDPDCAVGIMETFSKAHPDWKTKGTFFILPEYHNPRTGRTSPVPFYDPNTVGEKIDYLLSHGYEIQNHTTTHAQLSKLSPDRVEWEIGNAAHSIEQLSPKLKPDIVALPYGRLPRSEARKYLLDGSAEGTHYHNRAVVLAAYRPVASPITKIGKKTAVYQVAPFNPLRIERIKPAPEMADKPGTFEYWLKFFDNNPTLRYVSGGNPDVVPVPKSMKAIVDADRVRKLGKTFQPYSFSGGSGAGLSVESSGSGSKPSGSGLSVESTPR